MGNIEPCLCGDPYCARCGHMTLDDCEYDGIIYPEHDYGEIECRRCGAEAPTEEYDDEEGEE